MTKGRCLGEGPLGVRWEYGDAGTEKPKEDYSQGYNQHPFCARAFPSIWHRIPQSSHGAQSLEMQLTLGEAEGIKRFPSTSLMPPLQRCL